MAALVPAVELLEELEAVMSLQRVAVVKALGTVPPAGSLLFLEAATVPEVEVLV